jgi:hypothetical protein
LFKLKLYFMVWIYIFFKCILWSEYFFKTQYLFRYEWYLFRSECLLWLGYLSCSEYFLW